MLLLLRGKAYKACALTAAFLQFVGLELPSHHVTGIDLGIVTPLFRQIIQREDCCNRADGHTGAAINTLYGIDVELLNFIKARPAVIVGCVLLRMNAIHRTRIYTRRVFWSRYRARQ